MKTDSDLERQLRSILREELDHGVGPDPTWAESPAARRVAEVERRARYRWPLRLLAVAALITIGAGSALLLNSPEDPPALGQNGWIAYTVSDPVGDGYDQDVWFIGLDQEARRVIGSDDDTVNELCPAFSPDGRHLAYGRVTGQSTQYFVDSDGREGSRPATYNGAALVVAEVANDGQVTDQFTIPIGDDLPPPCPIWSPDGERIAFGVPLTSSINPTRSAQGSAVWILTLADRSMTVLPDLLATDLEFSPDGSQLAIASGTELVPNGGRLPDGRVLLYELASGSMRMLQGTERATDFTWSPDGERIAYATGERNPELRVIDLATGDQRVLSPAFDANHGIGPVWSPSGEWIAYQRIHCEPGGCSGEGHDIVLVSPDDLSADGAPREEVIQVIYPSSAGGDGSDSWLKPYWVTWSPDGQYLLFPGWSSEVDPLLGVVPATPGGVPDVLLTEHGLDVNPVYDGGPFVPIQSWGRLPAGAAIPAPASDAPEMSVAEPSPSPSPWTGLPAGPHLLVEGTDNGVPITVTIPASGWNADPNGGDLCLGDPLQACAFPPYGAGLVAFEGREFYVYGEACRWASTRPDAPATTIDALMEALAKQGSRDESGPEDITVGGYPGKRISLPMHPVSIDACDDGRIAMFGMPGIDPARYAENSDLIEEVWAVDVDGLTVVLDATYYAETPQAAVDELRAILASAAFE